MDNQFLFNFSTDLGGTMKCPKCKKKMLLRGTAFAPHTVQTWECECGYKLKETVKL